MGCIVCSKALVRRRLRVVLLLGAAAILAFWARLYLNLVHLDDPQPQLDAPLLIDDIPKPSINQTLHSLDHSNQTTPCFTTECFQLQARQIARAWSTKHHEEWCWPHSKPRKFWLGLILIKVPKAASSTLAGLVLRIANETDCQAVQWEHRRGIHYHHRATDATYLLSSVRHPDSRALSAAWFFRIDPLNIAPTDDNVIGELQSYRARDTRGKGGYQYNYMSLEPIPDYFLWDEQEPNQLKVDNVPKLTSRLRTLIHTYDFIMPVERLDESLTALALLTGLELTQVLIAASAKTSGGHVLVRHGRMTGKCVHHGSSSSARQSKKVQDFLSSPTWMAQNYADYLLHAAANLSLDLTIEQTIGRERFNKALAKFRQLKAMVQQACGERLGSGCDAQGQPIVPVEACYERDFGCGYQCVNQALKSRKE